MPQSILNFAVVSSVLDGLILWNAPLIPSCVRCQVKTSSTNQEARTHSSYFCSLSWSDVCHHCRRRCRCNSSRDSAVKKGGCEEFLFVWTQPPSLHQDTYSLIRVEVETKESVVKLELAVAKENASLSVALTLPSDKKSYSGPLSVVKNTLTNILLD